MNDEINGLMREKRHWETQIVALGGANYKRGNQSMVDDEGREVPGTRGYKCVFSPTFSVSCLNKHVIGTLVERKSYQE